MKPKRIKDVISNFLKGSNFKEINETITINAVWKNIVGKTIYKNTEIKSIKNGKIIITTKTPIWRNYRRSGGTPKRNGGSCYKVSKKTKV